MIGNQERYERYYKGKNLNVLLDEEMMIKIEKEMKRKGIKSRGNIVREALTLYFNDKEEDKR